MAQRSHHIMISYGNPAWMGSPPPKLDESGRPSNGPRPGPPRRVRDTKYDSLGQTRPFTLELELGLIVRKANLEKRDLGASGLSAYFPKAGRGLLKEECMDSDFNSSDPDTGSLSQLAHELGERVKELNCLFGFSDIVDRADGSLERILEEAVELLPQSWDHAEVACARIVLRGMEVRSKKHGAATSTQTAEIMVHGEKAGAIELSYLEPRPHRFEGPFSEEERRLLNAVAERMGHVVERLSAEESLREKEEEFRERMTRITRVSTMGEMASSVAHEVNQPLSAIATYAQACRRMAESGSIGAAELLDVLERISEEALRAGNIIHRLRGLVQRHESDLGRCDIGDLLDEIAPLALVDARLNEVDLRFLVPSGIPPILADGVQIQQVVLNLIRNGIDAMVDIPPDRRTLEVSVASMDRTEVQVSVTDRGHGLPEGSQHVLYDPFFTTKKHGLGLGLSISRSVVATHSGRLWASREGDRKTTFYFTIPVFSEKEDA